MRRNRGLQPTWRHLLLSTLEELVEAPERDELRIAMLRDELNQITESQWEAGVDVAAIESRLREALSQAPQQ